MKKQLYIIAAMIACVLNSCTVDEYAKPQATDVGFNVVLLTEEGYGTGIFVADIAYKAELWFSAPTLEQRIKIEDLFFPGQKVRITNDNIIKISNICQIKTNGVSLKSPNAKWVYTSEYNPIKDVVSPIEIQNIGENNIAIVAKNVLSLQGKTDFSMNVSIAQPKLVINGSGSVVNSNYGTAKFTIEDGGLTVDAAEPVVFASYNKMFTLGKINISWQAIGKEHSQEILAIYRQKEIEVKTEGESNFYPKNTF